MSIVPVWQPYMNRALFLLSTLIISGTAACFILLQAQDQIPVVKATARQGELSGRIDFNALFESIKTGEMADLHASATAAPTRLAGTGGEQFASKLVKDELAGLGLETFVQSYPVTVPVTKWCRITDENGHVLPGLTISPFWPNLVRTCTTPPEGIIGEVVDVGRGSLLDLDGKHVAGKIALVTMTEGMAWLDAAKLGATAILFVASDDPKVYNDKALFFPANLPRFLLTGSAQRIVGKTVRLSARVDWEVREARNVFGVLSPPTPSEEALVVVSHTDSWSLVPDHAPGYQDACTLTSMIGIARALADQRAGLSRTVIFASLSGRYCASEGLRRLLDAVGSRSRFEPNIFRIQRRLAAAQQQRQLVEDAIIAFDSVDYWSLKATDEARLWRQFGQSVREVLASTVEGLLNQHVNEAIDRAAHARVQWSKHKRPVEGPLYNEFQDSMRQLKRARAAASADLVGLKKLFGDVLDAAQTRELSRDALQKSLDEAQAAYRYEHDSIRVANTLGKWKNTYYIFPLHDSSTGPLGVASDTTLGKNLRPTISAITGAWLRHHHFPDEDPRLRKKEFVLDQGRREGGSQPTLLRLRRNPGRYVAPDLAVGSGGIMARARHALFFFNGLSYQDSYQTPLDQFVDIDSVTAKTQLMAGIMAQLASGAIAMGRAGQDASGIVEWFADVQGEVVTTGGGNSLLPSRRVSNALVLFGGGGGKGGVQDYDIMRRGAVIQKSTDGRFRIPAVSAGSFPYTEAYTVDERTGQITGAKDLGPAGLRFPTTFYDKHRFYQKPENEMTIVISRLAPFDIYRTLGPDGQPVTVELLDARFRTPPQEFSVTEAWEQGTTVFVKPGDRFYIVFKDLLRRGGAPFKRVGKTGLAPRGFMLRSPESIWQKQTSSGFWADGYLAGVDQRSVFQDKDAALSLALANKVRLDAQIQTGVADPVTVELAQRAESHLKQGLDRLEQKNYSQAYQSLSASAAVSGRTYPQVRIAVFDAVGGILLYLLLIVPYAYLAERLLCGFSDIRIRLVGVIIAFLFAFGIIRWTHPAYALISSSTMILVGFLIFILCLLILGFLVGKFTEQIRSWRRTGVVTSQAGINESQMGAAGAAFTLGINNMRKRKMRTAFTVITLALISFCLVCFTSPRPQLKEKHIAIGPAAYNGIVLRDEADLEAMKTQYFNAGEFIPRFAREKRDEPIRYEPTVGPPQKAYLQGRLYVRSSESTVTGIDKTLLPGGKWFAKGQTDLCYLSQATAGELGIDPADLATQDVHVQFRGQRLAVFGVFDSEKVDAIRDPDHERITPRDLRRSGGLHQSHVRMKQQSEQFSGGAETAAISVVNHLRAEEIIILPLGEIPNQHSMVTTIDGSFTSAVVRFDNQSYGAMREWIGQMLDRTPTFVRYAIDGLAFFGARLRVVGLDGFVDVVVPLLVASFIVFNTMLGNVYERKNEIAIYSAVGLSPRHVFFLFLAESIVYAVIGVVSGYLLALVLQWVSHTGGDFLGLTVNYSSRSAIYVSITLMSVVIISTFWPAYYAARAAAPSERIGWKLPASTGTGKMKFDLPFTFIGRDVLAALPFVRSWFDEYGEDSSGEFTADTPFVDVAWDGQIPAFTVTSTVWLRPYDLGVSQKVGVTVGPSADPTVYQVSADIQLLTGSPTSWRRTNNHFVRLLRQHLLGWRRLSVGHKLRLYESGTAIITSDA